MARKEILCRIRFLMILLVNAFWVSESTRSRGWKRDLRTKPLSDDDVYFFFFFLKFKREGHSALPPTLVAKRLPEATEVSLLF